MIVQTTRDDLPISTVCQTSADGTGYSVSDLNGVRHILAAALPRSGATLHEQAQDALRTLAKIYREEGADGAIVQQTVFLRDPSCLGLARRIINGFYSPDLPATTYVLQPPCQGQWLAVEALGISRCSGGVEIERLGEGMVVTRYEDVTQVHLAHVPLGEKHGGVYELATHVFQAVTEALRLRGLKFEQVIRTWLYLGDIVGGEGETQRYKELNRDRTDFYRPLHFCQGHLPPGFLRTAYPASTGIGTCGNDLVMSCLALSTQRSDVMLLPLENSQQTSACDYPRQYGPQSPKFSRAMAFIAGDYATTMISGTASITAAVSRGQDDVAAQTHQTLDNIAALISERNFAANQAPGYGGTLEDLASVRVYLKRPEDYERTREICRQRLGQVPAIYTVADICRPELLVEIEGVAFTRRSLTPFLTRISP